MDALTSFKELATCGICFELFNEDNRCPRMLQCGHTYCHSCLEKILLQRTSCPTCKAEIKCKKVDYIPVNYFAKSLIYHANQDTNFRETLNSNRLESKGFCSEHSNDKQIRCMDCEVWICGTCSMLNHKQCRTLLAREAYKDLKCQLFIKAGKELMARKRKIDNVEISLRCFEAERKTLIKEIRKYETKLEECNVKIASINSLKVESSEFSENLRQVQTEAVTLKNDAEISNLFNKFDDLLAQRKNWLTQLENLKLYHTTLEDLRKLCQNRGVYVVDDENQPLYGKVSLIGEQIRISSFSSVKPRGLQIPFKEFLQNFSGSTNLPTMVYMKIKGEEYFSLETKEVDVVIVTYGTSPIVKNFVLLCSGLKRHSYKGMPLNYKDSLLQLNTNIPSVVELSEGAFFDSSIFYPLILKGFVKGHGVKNSRFSISLSDDFNWLFGHPIGVIISGFEEIKRLKNYSKFTLEDCGLVIDKRCGFKRLMLKIRKSFYLLHLYVEPFLLVSFAFVLIFEVLKIPLLLSIACTILLIFIYSYCMRNCFS